MKKKELSSLTKCIDENWDEFKNQNGYKVLNKEEMKKIIGGTGEDEDGHIYLTN